MSDVAEHAAMIVSTSDGWETVCSCGWRYECTSPAIAKNLEELHMSKSLVERDRLLIDAEIEAARQPQGDRP